MSIVTRTSTAALPQAREPAGGVSFVRAAMAVAAELGPVQRLRLSGLTAEHRHVQRGSALFRSGDALEAIYEVHEGVFKTSLVDASGRSQVTGFQMSGEMLGLDAIGAERHCVDAVALADARVCVVPFAGLNELLQDSSALQRLFHKALSREIVREQAMMLLLGTLNAAERIAAFVLDLLQRGVERGGSPEVLVLCMTREEIGSYLGLQIETVSRAFSRLQNEAVLEIRNRHLHVLDHAALQRLAHGGR